MREPHPSSRPTGGADCTKVNEDIGTFPHRGGQTRRGQEVVKLIADLAASQDDVDRAIALGKAVPRLERLQNILLCGLVAAVVILSVGYIHMTDEITKTHRQQTTIEHQIQEAEARVTRLIVMGKSGASPQTQP